MGIDGSDSRIHLQKIPEVDQADKQQQETNRGEAGVIRNKEEAERQKRKSKPTETERPDQLLVRQPPHRKKREDEKDAKHQDDTQSADSESDDTSPKKEIGGSLDIKA